MMNLLDKTYSSENVEKKWKTRWEETQCFSKHNLNKEPFSVLMPPPNVTGILHMGHTLNNTIQDILCRWARIQGKDVLWIPGTDHAGIATQSKVEKVLAKEGVKRQDLGREAFIERVKKWRDQHGNIIFDQLKMLGISCDWTRSIHTLDPQYSEAVLTAFVELYKRGYIYRGKRLVNWCPVSQTALSDEEVIMKPTKGALYTFLYKVVEKENTFIPIATTRPETIMGDSAVAVNPDDPRYKALIGLHCQCIFCDRIIPIIADEAVEKDFGTGALKITPAHDPVDFAIGQKYHLPIFDTFNPDATLNELGAPFTGMDRMQAREAVVKVLQERGLLQKIEPYEHNVGYSERANVPIEPRISEQWFLRYPKTEEAKKIVEEGRIQFWPKRWVKTYLHWLNNIQDWCISRQLWWGHRIPVWYNKKDRSQIHVSLHGPQDPENWEQDSDVLDTWFSSFLWPLGTADWPNKAGMEAKHFERYFPSSTLVSGPDILFFWITRMIISSLEFLEDRPVEKRIPFKNIFLTSIVRDAQGRKMSKSLGNSPDPIDLIKTFGADGLRMGLLSIAPQGQDVLFDERFLTQGRNFCTKLWNACRFRQMQGECSEHVNIQDLITKLEGKELSIYDRHMLMRLVAMMERFTNHLEKFEFNIAIKELQQCFKSEFCDWYLEVLKYAKVEHNGLAVQDLFLRQMLLMLHPFAPFITEELWEQLHLGQGFLHDGGWEFETITQWISKQCKGQEAEIQNIEALRTIVGELRALKAEQGLSKQKDTVVAVRLNNHGKQCFETHQSLLSQLVGVQTFEQTESEVNGPSVVTVWGTFTIQQSQAQLDPEKIAKQLQALEKHIGAAQQKLNNEKFMSSAPEKVIAGVRKLLEENQQKYQELKNLQK